MPPPPTATLAFGVQLDWVEDSPRAYADRLGHVPAVYGEYLSVPMSPEERASLFRHVEAVAQMHAAYMLTAEPQEGLDAVTPEVARSLARDLARINAMGVPVMLRFGHEMNGSWYPWGQSPTAYRKTFRMVSTAVRAAAPDTAMLWAPNYGGPYPFPGGAHEIHRGDPDFAVLDTNHDGRLTMQDDPYAPYYPGDTYVDWVGLTLYHWGNAWPWDANEVPEAGRFVHALVGTYAGSLGAEGGVPDFYTTYAVGHRKPMAITETAAFFATGVHTGASHLKIASAWWSQVFSPQVRHRFPRLKMVLWFEHRREETGVATSLGAIDWRATADESIRAAFRKALPTWTVFADRGVSGGGGHGAP